MAGAAAAQVPRRAASRLPSPPSFMRPDTPATPNPAAARLQALGAMWTVLLGWSNGANDAANSMGAAVGAGALTLRQAVLTGAVAEVTGASLLGVHVSKTISKGVIRTDDYADNPSEFCLHSFLDRGFNTLTAARKNAIDRQNALAGLAQMAGEITLLDAQRLAFPSENYLVLILSSWVAPSLRLSFDHSEA